MLSNKLCNDDKQCSNNYMCSFDEKNLNHSCQNLNQNNLYLGCLDKDYNNFEYISSNISFHHDNFKNCLDFSRKQVNKDGLNHNYLLYKKKKDSSVDLSSINIYLLCGNQNIATLPIQDYFDTECDINNQNCKFKAKKLLFNFIQANKINCKEKLYIEINYECYNEFNKNKEIIPINDLNDTFIFEVNCPKNKNNAKFQSKCISFYIDDNDKNKYTSINKKKLLYTCENPVYKTPRIVNNVNLYKKNIFKKSNNEISDFEHKINLKKKEIQNLEAKKYQKIHKINHNEDISLSNAMKNVDKINIQNDKNDVERKWKLFNNLDALQNIIDNQQYQDAIKPYKNKVYTIEEAMKIANEENESFFVYYHNSFELDQYSSKLYFIDVFKIDNNIFDKNTWNKSQNVTSGLLNFENYYSTSSSTADDIDIFKDYISNLLVYQQLMTDELKNLNNKNVDDVNNINDIVINNLNTNLDRKITTKNQAIKMNNTEENVNNSLINILTSIFIIFIIIYVFILLYFNAQVNNN